MAAEATTKRKTRTSESGSSSEAGDLELRQWRTPRSERRYEPKASAAAILWTVAGSVGAVLVGAGTFGQWFRGDERGPHELALPLMAAGAVLLALSAFFGAKHAKPVRVGDAGVALEDDDSDLVRIGWNEVTGVSLQSGALTIEANGRSIAIPLGQHGPAAAFALAEVRRRIPARAAGIDQAALNDRADSAAGEVLPLEPPQLAGTRCRKTEKVISFERDARLCGRCGEAYHKDGVPRRCVTCGAKLKAA